MREFIEKMRKAGLVVDVKEEVSADMQAPKMAAGTDKLLFFHKIGGHRAVMNLTASRKALSLALGIDEKKIVKTLADAKFDGKVVEDGTLPMKKPDLEQLPIMHHFPKDAGKYLTSGIVFSLLGRRGERLDPPDAGAGRPPRRSPAGRRPAHPRDGGEGDWQRARNSRSQ